jgi:hypothetical protein
MVERAERAPERSAPWATMAPPTGAPMGMPASGGSPDSTWVGSSGAASQSPSGRIGTSQSVAAWAYERDWTDDELFASGRRGTVRPDAGAPRRRPLDPRGAVIAAASAVAVIVTFFPWYRYNAIEGSSGTARAVLGSASLYAHGYGGWRLLIPLLAILALVLGLGNWLLRPGDRGAVMVFVVLRLVVLALLGLTVAAVFQHAPNGVELGGKVLESDFEVTVWPAVAAGVVALGASLAMVPQED